jgi:hypothetical protein
MAATSAKPCSQLAASSTSTSTVRTSTPRSAAASATSCAVLSERTVPIAS